MHNAHSVSDNVAPRVWSARLVDWFFKNTQVVLLFAIALIVGGVFSLMSLRSEGFPAPQIKIAVITNLYRGASPQEVETQVVKPIENAVSGIAGVNDVSSTAANSFGNIVVTFDASADFTGALSEIRNKVQSLSLPQDADKPEITVPSFGGSISYYAVSGDVTNVADLRKQGDFVKRELETVKGVKEFRILQKINDKVLVSWMPDQVTRFGLTPSGISQA
ncbi:MAG TPA: efflux RND transporter permease subunit, partial [Verrucomicrobiae bacterium]|nr:efflux RND transporter permease subunit [Verrucomicrobiae bacterium]